MAFTAHKPISTAGSIGDFGLWECFYLFCCCCSMSRMPTLVWCSNPGRMITSWHCWSLHWLWAPERNIYIYGHCLDITVSKLHFSRIGVCWTPLVNRCPSNSRLWPASSELAMPQIHLMTSGACAFSSYVVRTWKSQQPNVTETSEIFERKFDAPFLLVCFKSFFVSTESEMNAHVSTLD